MSDKSHLSDESDTSNKESAANANGQHIREYTRWQNERAANPDTPAFDKYMKQMRGEEPLSLLDQLKRALIFWNTTESTAEAVQTSDKPNRGPRF